MDYHYDRRTAATSARLDSKIRREANAALDRAGLGGRGRYRKPGAGLSAAWEVLEKFGLEPDAIPNAHLTGEPQGSITQDIAFSNEADAFSPVSITNSMLAFSWTELRDGVFECIAYLS